MDDEVDLSLRPEEGRVAGVDEERRVQQAQVVRSLRQLVWESVQHRVCKRGFLLPSCLGGCLLTTTARDTCPGPVPCPSAWACGPSQGWDALSVSTSLWLAWHHLDFDMHRKPTRARKGFGQATGLKAVQYETSRRPLPRSAPDSTEKVFQAVILRLSAPAGQGGGPDAVRLPVGAQPRRGHDSTCWDQGGSCQASTVRCWLESLRCGLISANGSASISEIGCTPV